jgi:hypothetical protein
MYIFFSIAAVTGSSHRMALVFIYQYNALSPAELGSAN